MLSIALCDDDHNVYYDLKSALTTFHIRYDEGYTLTYFKNAEELITAPADYNVLFLDIMLDGGLDGIEIGKTLRSNENTAIIHILTSRGDRLKDAYKASVMRYLEKPLQQNELDEALLASLKFLRSSKKFLSVTFKQKTHYIEQKDIIMVESYCRKRYIYTTTKRIETMEKWQSICNQLSDRGFFHVQKYILVNFSHIKTSTKQLVLMDNGRSVNFSQGAYDNFNISFMRYLRGNI